MGGVHERMVGAVKRAMFHVFKPNRPITRDAFHTALVVVEGILNSRPLMEPTTDSEQRQTLTPNHFLAVKPYRQLAVAPEGKWDKKLAWRALQDRLDQMWARFCVEMKGGLQGQSKWFKKQRDYREGDVVIVLDKKRRGVWPLGKIIRTEPSTDGIVRKVQVLTEGNNVRRPANGVVLLVPAGETGGRGDAVSL